MENDTHSIGGIGLRPDLPKRNINAGLPAGACLASFGQIPAPPGSSYRPLRFPTPGLRGLPGATRVLPSPRGLRAPLRPARRHDGQREHESGAGACQRPPICATTIPGGRGDAADFESAAPKGVGRRAPSAAPTLVRVGNQIHRGNLPLAGGGCIRDQGRRRERRG